MQHLDTILAEKGLEYTIQVAVCFPEFYDHIQHSSESVKKQLKEMCTFTCYGIYYYCIQFLELSVTS
jgi:hypothetical protein